MGDSMPLSTDVLIVGAGPVGMLLAHFLATSNVRTLVIEKEDTLPDIPRAVSLDDEGMRAFQAAGLDRPLTPHMVLGYGHRYHDRKGKLLFEVDPKQQEYGFPKRNRFHQPIVEEILRETLSAKPSVDLRFGARLTNMQLGAEGVDASFATGDVETWVRARYLVGCDGGSSLVRRLVGIEMTGGRHERPWIVVDTEENPDSARYSRVYGDPRRPSVSVATVGGRRRYEFMLLPGEGDEMLTDAKLFALLAPHCDLSKARITRRRIYTFNSLVAERFDQDGRIFLAGDAAHMMPPFQGQGLNTGIRDVFNLGWKLGAVISGTLSGEVLGTYDRERRPHARAMVELSEAAGRHLMTTSPVRAVMRDVGFRVSMLVPKIRSYFEQMRFKPAAAFADGFFFPNIAPAFDRLVGRMLPQTDVLLASGQRARLDDALGSGFALIALRPLPGEGAISALSERIRAPVLEIREGAIEDRANAVADINGTLVARLGQPVPDILLIRPDRFVAAAITLDKGDDLLNAVRPFLASGPVQDAAPALTSARSPGSVHASSC